MTVRVKILAISAVLLLLFAVVLVSSVIMQEHSSRKVAAINVKEWKVERLIDAGPTADGLAWAPAPRSK